MVRASKAPSDCVSLRSLLRYNSKSLTTNGLHDGHSQAKGTLSRLRACSM